MIIRGSDGMVGQRKKAVTAMDTPRQENARARRQAEQHGLDEELP